MEYKDIESQIDSVKGDIAAYEIIIFFVAIITVLSMSGGLGIVFGEAFGWLFFSAFGFASGMVLLVKLKHSKNYLNEIINNS